MPVNHVHRIACRDVKVNILTMNVDQVQLTLVTHRIEDTHVIGHAKFLILGLAHDMAACSLGSEKETICTGSDRSTSKGNRYFGDDFKPFFE